jgi:hypothetical protein
MSERKSKNIYKIHLKIEDADNQGNKTTACNLIGKILATFDTAKITCTDCKKLIKELDLK